MDAGVVERRHVAVLARRQPLEPRLAACTISRSTPAATTASASASSASFGILIVDADAALDRHRIATAAFMAATPSPTSRGSAIRHAPKRPFWTRSDGQPTLG